jgi:hypothetical protein
MKLELKSINFQPNMSEETNCYRAVLWVDGKPLAHLKNSGRGEGDCADPHEKSGLNMPQVYEKLKEVSKFTDENLKPDDWKYDFPYDWEMWVGDQLNMYDLKKYFRRKLNAGAIVFRGGKVLFAKCSKLQMPRVLAKAEKTDVILNNLPFEEAFQKWYEHHKLDT